MWRHSSTLSWLAWEVVVISRFSHRELRPSLCWSFSHSLGRLITDQAVAWMELEKLRRHIEALA